VIHVYIASSLAVGFALCPSLSNAQSATRDSTAHNSSTLLASLSAAYAVNKTQQGNSFNNITVNGSFFFQHDLQRDSTWRHQHRVVADLSYIKFVDSIWVKGIDRLQANFLWSRNTRKWTQSWSVVFATQWLPDIKYSYDPDRQKMVSRNVGGICVPGSLELGYGATWYPWPGSSLQFAFATAKLLSAPKATLLDPTKEHLVQTTSTVFDIYYGASLLVNIKHTLSDRVDWINTSRFFANGADRDHVALDFTNRIAVKLFKYVQLRFDTRLGYDPLVSYNMKFSQEVTLGLYYEHHKS